MQHGIVADNTVDNTVIHLQQLQCSVSLLGYHCKHFQNLEALSNANFFSALTL